MGRTVKARVIESLPQRIQDSLNIVRVATIKGELPLHVRAQLLIHAPRMLTRRSRSADLRLVLPGGPVFLGYKTSYIDALVLDYLWNAHVFGASCEDRVVLDLGAHKGYFGAWALKHGASLVISCEPESTNFEVLEKTRAENDRSRDWEVERIAVGASAGQVSLYVSEESWAHSLYEEMVNATSVETVPMVTLASLMKRAGQARPGKPVVIKVNVEGAAGPILMAASPDELSSVVEIHIDYEPGSPYEINDLLDHLALAGLDKVNVISDKKWMVSRTRDADTSADRSANSRNGIDVMEG
jgi:FkbM family methyltransferase